MILQSDTLGLLGRKSVESVAANAYGVCEYLDTLRLDEYVDWNALSMSLAFHGHCCQKATKKDYQILRRAGNTVDPLDSGCCSMAGSFGYEAEHYSLSRSISDILIDRSRTVTRPLLPQWGS